MSEPTARPEIHATIDALRRTACHPVLPTEARVALTPRLPGGLTADERLARNAGCRIGDPRDSGCCTATTAIATR